MITEDDLQFIELASSSSSLAEVPGKNNWLEKSGQGLPPYVRKIARGIMKSGKSKSQAIAIALSRVKKWSAGGDNVDADTRAKSAKAVAQWEKAKAKNKSKSVVTATNLDGDEYVLLSSSSSYNTEMVRRAWDTQERERRAQYEAAHPVPSDRVAPTSELYPYRWIREMWSDYIIVEVEGEDGLRFEKYPYSYSDGSITFGEPTPVEQVWQDVKDDDGDLNSKEKDLLKDILVRNENRLGKLISTKKG